MKKIALLILLFTFFNGLSQSLSEKERLKLKKLDIKTEKLDINSLNIQNNLNRILVLDRKRRKDKIIGIILTSESVTSFILGEIVLRKDNGITDVMGGLMIAGGVVSAGVSIPFLNSSKKRKKERDQLIKRVKK